MFVEILGTSHACSHRYVYINYTDDHYFVELKPNTTNHDVATHIYKCYINVDLTKYWKAAKEAGIVNDTN